MTDERLEQLGSRIAFEYGLGSQDSRELIGELLKLKAALAAERVRVAELEATLREIKDAAKCDDYDELIVQLRGVAELEADRERLRGILDLSRHKVHEHLPSRVLALLHNQQISMGKACEWLRDYANGKQGPLTDAELVDTAELEADRKRLDWLEANPTEYFQKTVGWSMFTTDHDFMTDPEYANGKTLREAIDAAREAAKG